MIARDTTVTGGTRGATITGAMIRRRHALRHALTLALALVAAVLLEASPGPAAQAAERGRVVAGARVFEVQGTAHVSPLAGQQVVDVPGVVTALRSNGFYLQDPDGDGDPATSDAVFVYTRAAPTVRLGDDVRVSGWVRELRPADAETSLSVTEISATSVSAVGSGRPLPAAVVLGAGGRAIPARLVAEGVAGDPGAAGDPGMAGDPGVTGDLDLAPALRPDESAIDFFESLEGMRVQVNDAVAVGRRVGTGELAVLPDGGAGVERRTGRGGVLAAGPGETPARVLLADGALRTPPASVGDRFPGPAVGVIDYAFGGYRVRLTELLVATFNVENLSARERPAKLAQLAETVVGRLGGPDLLALQEVQDDSGAGDDGTVAAGRSARALTEAIRAAGGPAYEYREIVPENNQDGGEPGANIRVGFLFRTDRGLAFVERPGGDAVTPVAVVADAEPEPAAAGGSGPRLSASPGRIEPGSPAWLESRKPLVGEFTFNGHRLFVVAVHFASKRGDGPLFGRFQPPARPSEAQRVEQGRVVHAFARSLLDADPAAKLIVLGDLNDVPGSAPVAALAGGLLVNLLETLPEPERYSYVFNGQSEAIDQILVSPGLLAASPVVDVVHGHAEIVGAPSDHDPVLARFTLPPRSPNGQSRTNVLRCGHTAG